MANHSGLLWLNSFHDASGPVLEDEQVQISIENYGPDGIAIHLQRHDDSSAIITLTISVPEFYGFVHDLIEIPFRS